MASTTATRSRRELAATGDPALADPTSTARVLRTVGESFRNFSVVAHARGRAARRARPAPARGRRARARRSRPTSPTSPGSPAIGEHLFATGGDRRAGSARPSYHRSGERVARGPRCCGRVDCVTCSGSSRRGSRSPTSASPTSCCSRRSRARTATASSCSRRCGPTTGQTVYPQDLVGTVVDEVERPLVTRAFWRPARSSRATRRCSGSRERAHVQCIPVRLAAIGDRGRHAGDTARPSAGASASSSAPTLDCSTASRTMIADGTFPFRQDDDEIEDAPPRRRRRDRPRRRPAGAVREPERGELDAPHRHPRRTRQGAAPRRRSASTRTPSTARDAARACRSPRRSSAARRRCLLRAIPLLDGDEVVGVVRAAARRHRPPSPRPDAAVEGRDDPRDPPPGEEQPADDRLAAAAAGPAAAVARGAGGARGVGAAHPLDRDRARDAVARRRRRRALRRHRAAARAGGARRRSSTPDARSALRGRGRRRRAARRGRHAARGRAQRADAERGRPRVPDRSTARRRATSRCASPATTACVEVDVVDDGVGLPPGLLARAVVAGSACRSCRRW